MTVYKDGRVLTVSRVSTGKAGHVTPTGVFSIFQKRRFHRSNIYSGAPMPFMQRITWSGIALHMGRVPGYPASHGCVRLPAQFARKFFGMTPMRMHVVVARAGQAPVSMSHPNLPAFPDAEMPPVASVSARAVSMMPNMSNQIRFDMGSPSGSAKPMRTSFQVNQPAMLQRPQPAAWTRASEVAVGRDVSSVKIKRSGAPLRILVTRRSNRDLIVETQRRLLLLGFAAGDVDGQLGPTTVKAIKAFQTKQGLKVTGLGNEETRARLAELTGLPWPATVVVYLRQNGEQIYSGPVTLENADQPMGTHLFTLIGQYESEKDAVWSAMTLQNKGRMPSWSRRKWRQKLDDITSMTARQAIDRVQFPRHVRSLIEQRLTNGSSLVLADSGSTRETGIGTDFIVLTD